MQGVRKREFESQEEAPVFAFIAFSGQNFCPGYKDLAITN